MLLALQMVLGRRTLWLPRRFKDRELGASITQKAVPFIGRRIRWFERFSEPRLAGLFEHRWFVRILGLVIIVFTIGAARRPSVLGSRHAARARRGRDLSRRSSSKTSSCSASAADRYGRHLLIVTIGAAIAHFLRDHI